MFSFDFISYHMLIITFIFLVSTMMRSNEKTNSDLNINFLCTLFAHACIKSACEENGVEMFSIVFTVVVYY